MCCLLILAALQPQCLYQVQQNMRSQRNQYRSYWIHWHELIESVSKNPQEPISIAIAGGGAGGIELALSMQSHLHQILRQTQQPIQNLEIHLFQRQTELMPNYHSSVRHQTQQILTERGIKLHLGETVCKVAHTTYREIK